MSIYSKSFNKNIFNNPNTSLYKIFNLINKDSKTILDIGCSSGYLGEQLIKVIGCKCYGVEYDKHDFQIAKKKLTKVLQKNLENTNITKIYPKIKFDCIIFADILEHLKNPETTIRQSKQILSKKGHIYISIPNITHTSVLLELISNQWNYEESGILDKTHLKFFSYSSIVELLESNGFFIESVDSTTNELPDVFIKKILTKNKITPSKEVMEIFNSPQKRVFQYIIKATNKPIENYISYKTKAAKVTPVSDWINDYQYFSDTKKELDEIKSSNFWKIYKFFSKKI